MRRTKLLRSCLAAIILTFGHGFGSPLPALANEASPLKKCVNETEALSVLFLVDTSASLRRTDPDDKRVIGLKLALAALATRRDAQSNSKAVPVYVDFLSFGTKTNRTFTPSEWPVWGEIPSNPDTLIGQMDKFAGEDGASDTDYVSALDPYPAGSSGTRDQLGALEHLKAAPSSCRLLVWFTDGQLDFDPPAAGRPSKQLSWSDLVVSDERSALAASAQGAEKLCESGGPADRLRSGSISDSGEGTQLAVVALGENLPDFELIGRIAEGNCGAKEPRGRIYPANDVNGLIGNLLEATLGEGDGPLDDEVTSCVGGSCDDIDASKVEGFDYPFTLTPGIDSFNLIALKGDEQITSVLVSPDGQQLTLDDIVNPVVMTNDTQIERRTFPGAPNVQHVRAKLGNNPNAWSGQWRLRFKTTNAQAARQLNRVALYVYPGELQLRLREPNVVRRGRSSMVIVELVTADGRLIAKPEFMPEPDLSVLINGTAVDTGNLREDGTWQFDYAVDSDIPEEMLTFDAELALRAQVDLNRDPIELELWRYEDFGLVEVRNIPKYPLLDAPVAPFKDALSQKKTLITTSFVVEASSEAESGGCVELVTVSSAVDPDGEIEGLVSVSDGNREITVGDPCAIELKSGEQRVLTIAMAINGKDVSAQRTSLTGSLLFRSTSTTDATEFGEYEKSVTASVVPEFVTDTDWARVIVLTLLALLGPFIVMYVLNFAGKSIDVGPGASVMIPVRFAAGRLLRRDGADSRDLVIEDRDLDIVGMPLPGRYRKVEVGGVNFEGRMSLSPFADTSGSARPSDATFVIANNGTDPRHLEVGLLGPTLKDAWVFRADSLPVREDETYKSLDGVLTMIVPSDANTAKAFFSAERLAEIETVIGSAFHRYAADSEPEAKIDEPVSGASEGTDVEGDPLRLPKTPSSPGPVDPFFIQPENPEQPSQPF